MKHMMIPNFLLYSPDEFFLLPVSSFWRHNITHTGNKKRNLHLLSTPHYHFIIDAFYLVKAAATPPSTVIIHPVVLDAFEDDKNAIDSAISSGRILTFKIVRSR